MIRIGIDPGVRECGVAIEFDYDRFMRSRQEAFIVRSTAESLHERAIDMFRKIGLCAPVWGSYPLALCVEGQQIYRPENSKGDPNDMIKVAIVAGIMVGAIAASSDPQGAQVAIPLPRQWKGGIKKDKHHVRLKRDYPQWVQPVQRDTPKSLQHHVWDAVGLLEWHKERSTT